MGSPLNLAKVEKTIGRMYGMYKAIVEGERMA